MRGWNSVGNEPRMLAFLDALSSRTWTGSDVAVIRQMRRDGWGVALDRLFLDIDRHPSYVAVCGGVRSPALARSLTEVRDEVLRAHGSGHT